MDLSKSKRILIVEDEIIIAMDIQNTLKSLGYESISIAESGESAIEAVAESRPDLILMDIGLSGSMDGIDTATQIQAVAPGLPVMFLTSYSNLKVRERAEKVPHCGYLLKPFSPDLLGDAVIRVLSDQRTQ
ncbi:MAG TPA: response regulator [Spirochaetota bacterium]